MALAKTTRRSSSRGHRSARYMHREEAKVAAKKRGRREDRQREQEERT